MNIVVMKRLVIPEMTSVIDALDQSTHLVVQFIHLKNISTGIFYYNETFFIRVSLNLKFLYLSLKRFLPKDISGTF